MAKPFVHRELHPIANEIFDRSLDEYLGIKKIIYSNSVMSGYVLDELNVKECDQSDDVHFYVNMVDWDLDSKSARRLLDEIHMRIRKSYHGFDQILWWNINYWAFFKTLSIYAGMKKVNKKHLINIIKVHRLEKMYPFQSISDASNKTTIRKAINFCLHSWCSVRRDVSGDLVVGVV